VASAADQDGKRERTNENDNDGGHDEKRSNSSQNGGGGGCGGANSKQRKAARWKSMNKKKKDQKRRKFEQKDGEQRHEKKKKFKKETWKRDYDEGSASPHLGSFANEKMRKLFDVSVDAPPSGGEGKGENVTTDRDDDVANGEGPINNSTTADNGDAAEDAAKVPKRKLALLVSFLGSNYGGFQINDEKRTLQAEIELALYRAGIISKMNFGHPSKYGWSNSARTDKGVHAAAQVVSLKGEMIFHNEMEVETKAKEELDAMREKVNEHLPEDIRILDVERVTRMFCARTARDKVRYQYMVPSFCLCSREEVREAFAGVENVEPMDESKMTPMEASNIVKDTLNSEVLANARDVLLKHRVTSEQMERLRSGLRLFEGTHPFHNYTRRVTASDASAVRYILSFEPLDPILSPGGLNEDGSKKPDTQWIPLQVVGQSFLLNQIRKMVSAAVDLARGAVSEERIRESLTKEHRVKVGVAPAQGLFLDRSYFELYNKHKVKNAPKHGDKTPDRNELDWVEVEGKDMPAAVRRIEEFKNEKIIPHIIREEAAEGNFLNYLFSQDVLCKHHIYGAIEDGDKSNIDGGVSGGK